MKNILRYKTSVLFISALLLIGCQPPAATEQQPTIGSETRADSPIVIDDDSVTMAADYILSIKPSRYQPSLGLQGEIEPTKQANLRALQPLVIKEVLIVAGQSIKEGEPLFIVQRQNPQTNTGNSAVKERKVAEDSNNAAQQKPSVVEQKAVDAIAVNNSNPSLGNNSATLDGSELSGREVSRPELSGLEANRSKANKTDNKVKENIAAGQTDATVKQQTALPKDTTQLITIKAPFNGRVDKLNIIAEQQVAADELLLNIADSADLSFVATLPIQAEPQLSVGQTVNFTVASLADKFTGQVSALTISDKSDQLLVSVRVINNETTKLKPGMTVTGRVDYGQIEVGTIVPREAIHGVDLTALKQAPYRPVMTLNANVWIIQQDQRLTRQPVEVIEYDPSTDRYLIAGVNNDSLICLAKLPLESAGKKVIVS